MLAYYVSIFESLIRKVLRAQSNQFASTDSGSQAASLGANASYLGVSDSAGFLDTFLKHYGEGQSECCHLARP